MRFRMLGPLEVWSAEKGWTGIGAAKWRSLLACLLLRPGQIVPTETLIAELWGQSPPPTANNMVSVYAHRLRGVIGDADGRILVYRKPGYQLLVTGTDTDLGVFEALVGEARGLLADGDSEAAAARLREAEDLWRGELLADVTPTIGATTESERLDELRLSAAELRAEADLRGGRHAEVIPGLRSLVAEHPLREGLWLLLIRALDGAGRHAEALDAYGRARAVIADELGVDPGPELQAQYADLLAADELARPSQLPADISDFTGRDAEVAHLRDALSTPEAAVRVAVVAGAAGLGKTTLAVRAAHQVRDRFGDGQLYADLLGASARPVAPGDVLARFLRDLGVDGDQIPAGTEERASLYRTRLAGRKVLVMLDNARDAAQVKVLLPGSESCAVLVTTRNRTPTLASTRFIDLDTLPDAEALDLFTRIVGDGRPMAEPDATAKVLTACAGLPLAIRICAARLAARRQWKVATLAGRLRDSRSRLDEMRAGDLEVRASFDVSYEALRENWRRAFRLLGLWQGRTICLPAATALIAERGEREADVAVVLEWLVDANLLESPAPDRYQFHDLLSVYARERAEAEESETERAEAVKRLLHWYLATAEAAAEMSSPHRYRMRFEASPGVTPLRFGAVEDVLDWYNGERENVVTATRQASAEGLDDVGWRLPAALLPVFNRRGNWADCVAAHRIALDSVRRSGNRQGEGWIEHNLGIALARMHDSESIGHLERALAIRREISDSAGEVQAALNIADAYFHLEGPEAALKHVLGSLDVVRRVGQFTDHVTVLNNLGEVYIEIGRLDEAAECFQQIMDMLRNIGDPWVEGHAMHNLGRVYLGQGRLSDADGALRKAVTLHRATGDQVGEAVALRFLGHVQRGIGQPGDARGSWATALRILSDLGETEQIREIERDLASLPVPEKLRSYMFRAPDFPLSGHANCRAGH